MRLRVSRRTRPMFGLSSGSSCSQPENCEKAQQAGRAWLTTQAKQRRHTYSKGTLGLYMPSLATHAERASLTRHFHPQDSTQGARCRPWLATLVKEGVVVDG